jgi:ElaB/YqjD/DUF883 family membrane-anchored ribosome-binding protein
MSNPPPSRFQSLATEVSALAQGYWQLLRQEMSGKAALTRQQIILMAAGAVTALTAILLILAGLTLLLSQLFVSQAGWEPLIAGGVSALIVALVFALTGWLLFRQGGSRLKQEGLAPTQTVQALKSAARTLTNQPIIPTPPPTPMNTRQFKDAVHQTADEVEHQARRAGRAMQDTARSFSQGFDPGAFFASALSWVDAVLTPQNRALASRALGAAATLPRRHPAVASALGLGALYMIWQKSRGTEACQRMEDYAADQAGHFKDAASQARRSAYQGFESAAATSRDLRDTVKDSASRVVDQGRQAASQFSHAATATAESVRQTYDQTREALSGGVEQLADTARHLRDEAEAGYKKAKEFAKEEPALAIAGGAALVIGALLLVKSSRR